MEYDFSDSWSSLLKKTLKAHCYHVCFLWYLSGNPGRNVGSVVEGWHPFRSNNGLFRKLLVVISVAKEAISLMISQNHAPLFLIELAIGYWFR